MKTDPNMRNAKFEDAGPIFDLIKQYPEELIPRPLSDIAQNIDRFLVYEVDSNIVGVVSWQILPEIGMPRNPAMEIRSLAVSPNHRKAGIGRSLVNAVIEIVKPFHPSQIIAMTFCPDFFKEFGFVEVSKQTIMHKIYTGCSNCAKYDSPFTCPETAMVLDLQAKPKRKT